MAQISICGQCASHTQTNCCMCMFINKPYIKECCINSDYIIRQMNLPGSWPIGYVQSLILRECRALWGSPDKAMKCMTMLGDVGKVLARYIQHLTFQDEDVYL